ncbi:hypothetical protein HXX76_008173 [Chlamydomonas incerta]|uniref:non-specific serine/threonine protein kinase n=1 Tax=Chlamydomonas incerta TaxID=51695 RepID=A0A835SXZ0_CHLIN|nr:hypothetical protein HXX76_008173 [Chlamydomonas incerta]|eukprot:KAG2433816.1 hypothetical protein HXX76_008173 [Chlamydomonas incerta]
MTAAAADRYERGHCIGRGSFGDVYEGLDTVTGQQVAIKVIDLDDVEDDIQDIHREIQALAGCKCRNITEYYGSVLRPGSAELHIIMELMACSVADLVHHGPLDEACIAYVLAQVLNALVYLHAEHRIHRDVKAANILLSRSGDVKITDFGVSGQLSGTLGYRRKTFVGTPFWMAPEVIDTSEEGYSEKADVWSLGITAIEMATGSPPHSALHPMRVLFLIPKGPPPALEGDAFSPELKDFVAACLKKDPAARPAARDLLAHPFVAAATQAPEHLPAMVAELARHKKPLSSRRDADEALIAAGGTMPAWDFGTAGAAAATARGKAAAAAAAAVAAAPPAGTVRAMAAAISAASTGGTIRGGAGAEALRETLRAPGSAAAGAAAARVETISRTAGMALKEALAAANGSSGASGGGGTGTLRYSNGAAGPTAPAAQGQYDSLVLPAPPTASPPPSTGGAPAPPARSVSGNGGGAASSPPPGLPRGAAPPAAKFATMSTAEARMYRDLMGRGGGAGATTTSSVGVSSGGVGGAGSSGAAATSMGGGGHSGTVVAAGLARNSLSVGTGATVGPAASKAANRYAAAPASSISSDDSSQQQQQQQPGAGEGSGGGASVTSPSAASAAAATAAAAAAMSDGYGTVQSRPAGVGAGGGAAAPSGSPSASAAPSGSLRSTSATTTSGTSGGAAAGAGGALSAYGTVQSRKQVEAAPAGGAPGGGPGAAAANAAATGSLLLDSGALAGLVAREGSPAESGAVLSRLLGPCARSAFNSADKASQAALAGVLGGLGQLEKMMPGASYRLVQELLVRLSCSAEPTLEPLRASAVGLYAATASAPASAAGTIAARGAAARPPAAYGSGAAAAAGGGGVPRAVPDLGPLGEFLLGRWREEEAHELALLARSQSAGPAAGLGLGVVPSLPGGSMRR